MTKHGRIERLQPQTIPKTGQALKAYTEDKEAKRDYQQNYKRKQWEQSNPQQKLHLREKRRNQREKERKKVEAANINWKKSLFKQINYPGYFL